MSPARSDTTPAVTPSRLPRPSQRARLRLLLAGVLLAGACPGTAAAGAPRADERSVVLRVHATDGVAARASSRAGTAGSKPAAPPASNLVPSYFWFLDPDPAVSCKEFAFVARDMPDTTLGPNGTRPLFHLIYQRSGGPVSDETTFGHAWSWDLENWSVDTLAFATDTTWWNAAHVWSPSIVRRGSTEYLFYTGVDAQDDQRIGYATTSQLDTTHIVWDPARVMVWEARNTAWAVPDPWTYFGQTQFRDADIVEDPDDPDRLLMFYEAHDSIDFKLGRGGLVAGVARSLPGTVDAWEDLGYYPSTLPQATHIGQLEGPNVFPVGGTKTGWRLMFSNAGSPYGETGETTIRFQTLAPGASLADTTPAHWSASTVLMRYLNGDPTVWGWSATEEVRAGGVDYLAGFTAWGPVFTGIAITAVVWHGDDFTLEHPAVTAVDEFRSPARGVRMSLAGHTPRARRVTFVFDSPLELAARLEVYDTMGRRSASLLAGTLPKGHSSLSWDLSAPGDASVPSGVYFARLSFAGGARVVRIPVVR